MIQNRLLHILLDKNTNMKELSDALDIPYATIWRFGKMQAGAVNFDVLNAICEYLEVQPGDLLVHVSEQPQ